MPIKNKKFKKYLEKHLTKPFFIRYNDLAKEIWSRGQAVKTPPFHGGIRGSIPLEITKKTALLLVFETSSKSIAFSLVFLFHDQTQLALRWRVGRDLRGFDYNGIERAVKKSCLLNLILKFDGVFIFFFFQSVSSNGACKDVVSIF